MKVLRGIILLSNISLTFSVFISHSLSLSLSLHIYISLYTYIYFHIYARFLLWMILLDLFKKHEAFYCIFHKTAVVWPPTSYLPVHPSSTNKTCESLLEKQGETHKRLLHMEIPVLADKQGLIYISTLQTLDAV